MNIDELKEKAIYIQFPINRFDEYKKYDIENIHRLPIHDSMLYEGFPGNSHHYMYDYTYKFVLPLLGNLCGFKFDKNDFNLKINKKTYNDKVYNFSYLLPKKKYEYKVTSFEDNITFSGGIECLMFNGRINKSWKNTGQVTEYHRVVPFPHSCFKIVNLSLKTTKKLLISGDSQMIPSIIPLTNYFKEVWYYDNRTDPHINHSKTYQNEKFDCVIFELYKKPLKKYIDDNLL